MSDGAVEARHAWIEPGVFEVAPGVHRIPLPLPNDGLRAVNVYAIEDGDGLVLVDSGWALDEARDQLESALGEIGYGFEDIRRFLVTHVHRDHYTLAVTLRRTFGSQISLGAGEQPSLEAILDGNQEMEAERLRRWGAGDLLTKLADAYGGKAPKSRSPYELPDEWLDGKVEVPLKTRTLLAVPTPGHTAGHVVFLDSASSLLFSGDHILPHITPSIGVEPARPELPLRDYLDSLRLMQSYPDMRLLPAHGSVGGSSHGRIAELLQHHEERLEQTAGAIRDGAGTAYEAALKLGWTRRNRALLDMDLFNQVLAVGETNAHLDVLVTRGVLTATADDDGIREYTLAG
ncbi:Glyoxylase, beta-lactamase superfamily II [Saccharopolyspora antimicrobica]|uniref:Glyoxylase, beta-lactamase superfamily II n=1 Tax=Saccharopolyspora antimicrobica TaxID=455193 RepID=A0A1I5J5G1_9PSEU|nr:MBL fold metallo-hydrolase [Saccharopolyspora antimicrobica]RKT82029.1 glyoxylase-like metal-dependent hydrolase (beta-lactamase superfamily II) [Saccharopolyspora antimicrobica]SFO67860.1 Glyoxylase, beta-lactamase superfamily II [Saccharopolyspora antimicrobica]